MKVDRDILTEYECADPERRLYLFLLHRDFRSAFAEIDENESSSASPDRSGSRALASSRAKPARDRP